MQQIQVNYEQLNVTAADVRRYAGDVREAITALKADVNQLTPTWEGQARSAFDIAFAECDNEIKHFPNMLEQLQAALEFAAQTMSTAEGVVTGAIVETVQSDTAK